MNIKDYQTKFEGSFSVCKNTGCWLWEKALDTKGYGQMRLDTRKYHRSHRISFRLYKGSIPSGLNVLHQCDVPRCVNPGHLYAGTQKQNIKDMMDRKRANPAKGEKSGRAVLKKKQVLFILKKSIPYHPEFGRAALARRFGVAASTVSEILIGNNWRHLYVTGSLTSKN